MAGSPGVGHIESQTGPQGTKPAGSMSGAAGAQREDGTHQDASFLNAANGPRISERGAQAVGSRLQNIVSTNPAPGSPKSRVNEMGNSYTEYNDGTTTDMLDRSQATMGRAYSPRPGQERPEVSFHVNPDFDHDGNTNSDVLLQGYESHNRIPNWPQPQQGQQYAAVRTLPCLM